MIFIHKIQPQSKNTHIGHANMMFLLVLFVAYHGDNRTIAHVANIITVQLNVSGGWPVQTHLSEWCQSECCTGPQYTCWTLAQLERNMFLIRSQLIIRPCFSQFQQLRIHRDQQDEPWLSLTDSMSWAAWKQLLRSRLNQMCNHLWWWCLFNTREPELVLTVALKLLPYLGRSPLGHANLAVESCFYACCWNNKVVLCWKRSRSCSGTLFPRL